jgi:hypothetical protein
MFGLIPPIVSLRSTQAMADVNDCRVLAALARMGHLRLTEIARAGWPASTVASGSVSADKTLKRLVKRGHVLKKRNCMGSSSYVLTMGGVARLRRVGIVAVVGEGITVHSPQFMHQTLCARYLLERSAVDGAEVWGGYAVGSGRAPVPYRELKKRFGKLPDGFIAPLIPGGVPGAVLDWVEVEQSIKGTSDVLRVVRMGTHAGKFLDEAGTIKLGRVVIVYSTRQGHESAMLKGLETLLTDLTAQHAEALLAALVFVRCEFDPGVHQWKSCTEVPVAVVREEHRIRNGGKAAVPARPTLTEAERQKLEDEWWDSPAGQAELARREAKRNEN